MPPTPRKGSEPAWRGWAREAGKGKMGAEGTREQCGSNKGCTGSTF